MAMRVLITGAAGFIGRYVTAWALAEGHGVRATMRLEGRDRGRDPGREAALGDPGS